MSKAEDGGPAFPAVAVGTSLPWNTMQGMSLRDWFAGQALVGLSATRDGSFPSVVAADAYSIADAMLARRSGEGSS